jgi:hypothetical protein
MDDQHANRKLHGLAQWDNGTDKPSRNGKEDETNLQRMQPFVGGNMRRRLQHLENEERV